MVTERKAHPVRRLVGAGAALVGALVGSLALASPAPAAAQQVQVVGCAHPQAAAYVPYSNGWCWAAEWNAYLNVYHNLLFDPSQQVLYDPGGGIAYNFATGWAHWPHLNLYYHPGANTLYDPTAALAYDLTHGIFYNPADGWFYEPVTGTFFSPQTGMFFQPQTSQLYGAPLVPGGFLQTGSPLLDNTLAAATVATQHNLALINQVAPALPTGGESIFSPLGQVRAMFGPAIRGVLSGQVPAERVAAQFRAANSLSAGQFTTQQVLNNYAQWRSGLPLTQNARAVSTDPFLLGLQASPVPR